MRRTGVDAGWIVQIPGRYAEWHRLLLSMRPRPFVDNCARGGFGGRGGGGGRRGTLGEPSVEGVVVAVGSGKRCLLPECIVVGVVEHRVLREAGGVLVGRVW